MINGGVPDAVRIWLGESFAWTAEGLIGQSPCLRENSGDLHDSTSHDIRLVAKMKPLSILLVHGQVRGVFLAEKRGMC